MRTYPWHAWLLLIRPSQVAANLRRLEQAGLIEEVPTLWQIEMGVLRMLHRMVVRPNTIGLCTAHPVRQSWRARLFARRGIRLPFVLWEGSVAPWDLSGLTSSPARLIRHLVGTHHEKGQFVYDLQLLVGVQGGLEEVRDRARDVIEGDDRRSRWLRDLVVYDNYHETLLAAVERALKHGFELSEDDANNPDVSLVAYLRWCGQQPATPREAWRALRAGRLSPDLAPAPRREDRASDLAMKIA